MQRNLKFDYVYYQHPCFILGLRFNTGIGQHILKNPMIIVNMIDKVSVISKNFLYGSFDQTDLIVDVFQCVKPNNLLRAKGSDHLLQILSDFTLTMKPTSLCADTSSPKNLLCKSFGPHFHTHSLYKATITSSPSKLPLLVTDGVDKFIIICS